MQVEFFPLCLVSSKYSATINCSYCQSHLYSSELPYEISTVIIPVLQLGLQHRLLRLGLGNHRAAWPLLTPQAQSS